MRSARLSLALDSGAIVLPPTGQITVFRPHEGDDLSALPKDRVTVVQGFRPDHDAFAAMGYRLAVQSQGQATAALICLPRSRGEGRALVAEAAAHVVPGGLVIVDGQKTDGIDSMARDIRARKEISLPLAKAHGRIFAFPAGPGFEGWAAHPVEVDGFTTMPGMFSADGPDRGSILLAQVLPAKLSARVVDLGAGWGYLSRAILARDGVKRLDLVEAEAAALDCARINISDPRAHFHWADALSFRPEGAVDTVVMNPPFHVARAADPGLGVRFIAAAASMLHQGGVLWMVANRHLPYGSVLAEAFRDVEEVGGDGAFRLVRAARPLRARKS
ncbi:MAG: MFS transporter [Cereibacter sphaeroides]|uniref:MFS transporter n=1 Tax=Cereibacter sphaeroides TaxID=1063 RepID=A0A2W5TXA1_CERSP|nr:MAG: MFS transporter [Cereibacter sphaeroides]